MLELFSTAAATRFHVVIIMVESSGEMLMGFRDKCLIARKPLFKIEISNGIVKGAKTPSLSTH